jgi:NTP pyrophosphatase (non-canonical NTP hydrolase)
MNRQEHLLTCLAEEAGEIVQAVTKALRFGLDDGYPGTDRTNKMDIQIEIRQLIAVKEMLEKRGYLPYLSETQDRGMKNHKKDKVVKYMEYAIKTGSLK